MALPPAHLHRIFGLNDVALIWLCYILYAATPFFGGVPAIAAVIINYIKRAEARSGDALVYSHMQWQLATFWLSLLLGAAAVLGSVLLYMSAVGVVLIYPMWIALFIWYAYRIIKGMLAINAGRHVE